MDSPVLTQPVARKRGARHLEDAYGLTHLGNLFVDTARGLALRSGSGTIKVMETKYFLASAEREEPGAQDREDPRHSQSHRLDDETSGWKTFGDVFVIC